MLNFQIISAVDFVKIVQFADLICYSTQKMTPTALLQGETELLEPFKQIGKFAVRKSVPQRDEFSMLLEIESLTFFFIQEGKFEWFVNGVSCVLLPHDLLVLHPKDLLSFGGGILETGTYVELSINEIDDVLFNRSWSGLTVPDGLLIKQALEQNFPLIIQDLKEASRILQTLINELTGCRLGHFTRVNGLIDEFFITITRALSVENNQSHDFPKVFLKLDKMLRENLGHPWTVNEMGSMVGLGTTAFTEKIKYYTGFAPLQYLINLRVAEAMRMIKNTDYSMTRIALELGFYSSQHFSSTFKKLTGFSPKNYRKNGL